MEQGAIRIPVFKGTVTETCADYVAQLGQKTLFFR